MATVELQVLQSDILAEAGAVSVRLGLKRKERRPGTILMEDMICLRCPAEK